MNNYDFLVLSPSEFEELSRDLLQKYLQVQFESFADGKDGGIDLRCIQSNTDERIIVQAKRYKDFNSFFQNLKKEERKVHKLKPFRYILTTSVDLTIDNKNKIKELFSNHNLSLADIYGKKDLNNFLNQFPDIESQYYKLWFSSVNILEKIIHSKIYTQSQFELEEIKSTLKYYVHHDGFNDALRILKEHRYLIISGIPGIGKTTLARMLIQYLIAEKDSKFNNFVFLNSTIDEGYELYQSGLKKEQKTIYLFDDFLGKNFLEQSKNPNEDKKITNFIKAIQRDKKDLIVFTTREYILRQSSNHYESFSIENIEVAKCILDLSTYTKTIKAKILYNHLFFSGLQSDYLRSLVESKGYEALISHPNYNPRIIETIVKSKAWQNCEAMNITKHLLGFFDNPESVWLKAFENSLNQLSRIALLVLLTIRQPIEISCWEHAIIGYANSNNLLSFDSFKFSKVINELEETFITTHLSSDEIVVDFQNPSIQDFLVAYLNNNNSQITIGLINSFIYFEQFFYLFVYTENIKNKVKISKRSAEELLNKINKDFEKLIPLPRPNNIYNTGTSYFNFVIKTHNLGSQINYNNYEEMTINLTNKILNSDARYYKHIISFTELLEIIEIDKLTIKPYDLLVIFSENLNSIDDLSDFEYLKVYFENDFETLIKHEGFREIMYDVTCSEVRSINSDDYYHLENMLEKTKSIEATYSLDLYDERKILDSYIEEFEYRNERDEEYDVPDIDSKTEDTELTEDEIITNMFNGLLD